MTPAGWTSRVDWQPLPYWVLLAALVVGLLVLACLCLDWVGDVLAAHVDSRDAWARVDADRRQRLEAIAQMGPRGASLVRRESGICCVDFGIVTDCDRRIDRYRCPVCDATWTARCPDAELEFWRPE